MRILICDDDPDFRTLAHRQVRREFLEDEVVEVGDPAGLADALSAEPAPGLLVSDYSLKWGDGFDVLAAVRARAPDCPAVMFTGTGDEELAVRAIKAGFDDYVVKSPKQLRRLAAACRAAVERTETRERLRRHGELLTHELYHRLHNNLQLVIGLISFTARSLSDPEARARLGDLALRVGSLSRLQERLYRGGNLREIDFAAYLRELADDLATLGDGRVAVEIRTGDGVLPVDVAVPLGLVANELMTNALKHAFPEGRGGRVTVGLRIASGELELEVRDDGVGIATGAASGAPLGTGSGSGIVERLVAQMRGRLDVSLGVEGGTRCLVTVPREAPS
ncbi:histidine kinase dimerization/phosphoacceptor domain -containing protein [Roseomonas sp. CCTCC AB2023176]|uniref:histidine kinase dimerization/phosphoacceptor domain -containing protein n=1 Tax=Roseomonas sp. CCTCC AB2023176 TaxID=3342640 RepID=UPI0035D898AD